MRKLLLLLAAVIVVSFSLNAQGTFKVGANLALPIGDAGDVSSISIGLDAAYLFGVSEQFDVGPAIGFTNAILDSDYDAFDDVQFLPIAAAGRFNINESMYAGADLGYAVGINEGNDGGFYYRPRFGYSFTDLIGVNVSYTGISADGGDWSTIGVGVEFSF